MNETPDTAQRRRSRSLPLAPCSAFSGHTPGPWVLDYDKGSTQDILSRKHGGICTVRRAGRHDNATFAANARLIAAAPELLRVTLLARDAVEAGAIDECYLSLLRDAIAALPNTEGLVTPGTGHSAENAPASRRHQ